MTVENLMESIVAALPETSRGGSKTIREVCLLFSLYDGGWSTLAGGHPSVHIGEWGGDFQGEGETAEAALAACLEAVKTGQRS